MTSKYQALIQLWTGHFEPPGPGSSLVGLAAFLADHNVEYCSAEELCRVHHPELLDESERHIHLDGRSYLINMRCV